MRLNIRNIQIIAAVLMALVSFQSQAQNRGIRGRGGDVFVPISKYIQNGDAEKLSAWFAPNLELEVIGERTDCSKIQAAQIMKNFFTEYTPKSFTIIHKSGNPPMKYAIGNLSAGGETFRVILLARTHPSPAQLLQIRIEKSGGNSLN